MTNSRNKGARYELAIANHLTDNGIPATRNLEQTRDGGDDLTLPADLAAWLSLECKNVAATSIGTWIDQAIRQAGGRIAAVIHHRRGNGNPDHDYVTLTVADFLRLIRRARGNDLDTRYWNTRR